MTTDRTPANRTRRIAKDARLKAEAVAKWERRAAKGKPLRGAARYARAAERAERRRRHDVERAERAVQREAAAQ